MDEKLKAKWVKALRSGKYRQAREWLKGTVTLEEVWDDDNKEFYYLLDGERINELDDLPVGYCCLGVLCEIAPGIEREDEHYVIKSKKLKSLFGDPSDDGSDEYTFIRNDKDTYDVEISGESLPAPLVKHFGMNKKVVKDGSPTDVHSKLIKMNDAGDSFEKIANYIEKVL